MTLFKKYEFVRTWSWKEKLFIGFVALGTASCAAYVVLVVCWLLIQRIFGFGPHLSEFYNITKIVR